MLVIPPMNDDEFEFLTSFLRTQFGIHIPDNRKFFLETRLRKRLKDARISKWMDYIVKLGEFNSDETEHFVNAITSNKTHFFREEYHFEFLQKTVFPEYLGKQLNIWIGASSTGAEAYTLAMLLEKLNEQNPEHKIEYRILSTDIDTEALQASEEGIYPEYQVVGHVPQEFMTKYFFAGTGANSGKFKIDPKLKKNIKFRQHNLLGDKPISSMVFHLILFRNVFIYFEKSTIEKICRSSAMILSPEGYMILGHCESVVDMNTAFKHIGNSIYKLEGDSNG